MLLIYLTKLENRCITTNAVNSFVYIVQNRLVNNELECVCTEKVME
jgi:hypothetical protein